LSFLVEYNKIDCWF